MSETPLGILTLMPREYNALMRAGVDTVESLAVLTDQEILQIRNVGRSGLFAIRRALAVGTTTSRDDRMNLRERVAQRIFAFGRNHALQSGYDVGHMTWTNQGAEAQKGYYDLADAVLDELGIIGTAMADAPAVDAS